MNESKTVLLVDDEEGILEAYEGFLRPDLRPALRSARVSPRALSAEPTGCSDYSFLRARSGEEAIGLVERELEEGRRVACGFFDMKMPGGIDGLETIRRVRQLDGQVLCTIVTAYQDRSVDEINKLFQPDHLDEWDYLSKPFTKWEVVQKCRQMVESWGRRRREEAQLREITSLSKELEAWGHTLESRVEQRTAELAEANRSLEEKNGELRAVLDELAEAQAQLVQNEKMASLGQLAAGVAHEINNPVGFVHSNLGSLTKYVERITTFFDRLETDALPRLGAEAGAERVREAIARARDELKLDFILEDLPELIAQSRDGTERIKNIVSNLRNFSHPGHRTHREEDVNDGLRTTLNVVQAELRQRARLEVELGELPPVRCNLPELNQVWANLLINAGHALEGRNDGVVRLTTSAVDDEVHVVVSDNGCGIPDEAVDHVFEPFFTTKDVGKGTGLGLSVAYGIVKAHGGRIEISTASGEGTRFTVCLPAVPIPVGAAT